MTTSSTITVMAVPAHYFWLFHTDCSRVTVPAWLFPRDCSSVVIMDDPALMFYSNFLKCSRVTSWMFQSGCSRVIVTALSFWLFSSVCHDCSNVRSVCPWLVRFSSGTNPKILIRIQVLVHIRGPVTYYIYSTSEINNISNLLHDISKILSKYIMIILW